MSYRLEKKGKIWLEKIEIVFYVIKFVFILKLSNIKYIKRAWISQA